MTIGGQRGRRARVTVGPAALLMIHSRRGPIRWMLIGYWRGCTLFAFDWGFRAR